MSPSITGLLLIFLAFYVAIAQRPDRFVLVCVALILLADGLRRLFPRRPQPPRR